MRDRIESATVQDGSLTFSTTLNYHQHQDWPSSVNSCRPVPADAGFSFPRRAAARRSSMASATRNAPHDVTAVMRPYALSQSQIARAS